MEREREREWRGGMREGERERERERERGERNGMDGVEWNGECEWNVDEWNRYGMDEWNENGESGINGMEFNSSGVEWIEREWMDGEIERERERKWNERNGVERERREKLGSE